MNKLKILFFIFYFLIFNSCRAEHQTCDESRQKSGRVIHVLVALCDNENQGIVPVPEAIGNGQLPDQNLYWGAGYGVRNYFDRKSEKWQLVKVIKDPQKNILERVIFRHISQEVYLIADAYDGAEIQQTITDFLKASAGVLETNVDIGSKTISAGGCADLVAYMGHNGLMDFDIQKTISPDISRKRDVIAIACYSKNYFKEYLKNYNVNPLVWSRGLMSAEAYTLKWAIDGWLMNETNEEVVLRARKAYNHYQKCGMTGASNLLTTGF
ncbi:MAG: hypothetical protein K9H84_06200 [Bacteroidales bacterium]|nr:hypothetical protein [Bacteroidales bacterium]